jgi:hypothetical protein
MLSYIRSVCSMVNAMTQHLNQQDHEINPKTGRAFRNYVPIGTGTIFKSYIIQTAGAIVLLATQVLAGCYRDEKQHEFTCVTIRNGTVLLEYSSMVSLAWLACRVFR